MTKDKCMVANCEGIPIVCIQHVESTRKEGYDQALQMIPDTDVQLKQAEQRGADAKEKEIYEIILHISEGCPEEDCECQIIAEMLIPLMVRHEQRGKEARDAELLEEIKPLIITGAGARNENSAGWNIAIETVIRILSPPKPEEKKGD